MLKNKKIGIVVPAYNEEALITETLLGMPEYADRIYVVNDGSTDATGQKLQNFNGGRFCILNHDRNRGVGAAIITGYKKAMEEGIDIAVVMAGDNQMKSAHLPELLEPVIDGKADYAKGNRLSQLDHRAGMSNWRYVGNWILTLLTKISCGYWHIRDPQNGYTAITGEALTKIDLDRIYPWYGYCNDMLVKLNVAGCRVVDVPIPAVYGNEKSKIRYGKYIRRISPLLLRGLLWRMKMKYLTPKRRR